MKNLGLAKKRRDEARNNLRKAIDSITSISGGRISQFEALHAIVDTVMKSIDENLPANYKTLKGGLAQTYLASTIEQAFTGKLSTGEDEKDEDAILASLLWLKPVSMFPGEVVTVNPYGVKPGTKVTLYSKVTGQSVHGYDAGHPFSEIYIKNYKPAKGYAWHKEANGQVWLVPTDTATNPFGVPQGTKVKVVVKGCSLDKANTYDAGLAFGFTAPCVYEPVEGYEWVPMGDICWLKPVA